MVLRGLIQIDYHAIAIVNSPWFYFRACEAFYSEKKEVKISHA